MDFTYEQIEKYLLEYEIEGSKIHCEFQNENGEVYNASSSIKEDKSIQNKMAKRAERMIKSQAKRNAGRLMRTAFGGGMIGRLGSSFVRQSVNDAEINPLQKNFSEESIHEAIAKAFKRVARNFEITKNSKRPSMKRERPTSRSRRASETETALGEQLTYKEHIANNPITNMFEQDIMSRLLVQMAAADGKITEDEREFIMSFLPKKFGTIAEILDRGDISKIEAEELSHNTKKTIMLLAWSVALVDFELENSEERRLNEYANLLGIDSAEAMAISRMAKQETLTGIMEPYMDKKELFNLANSIDIGEDEAERMFIQFKKSM